MEVLSACIKKSVNKTTMVLELDKIMEMEIKELNVMVKSVKEEAAVMVLVKVAVVLELVLIMVMEMVLEIKELDVIHGK